MEGDLGLQTSIARKQEERDSVANLSHVFPYLFLIKFIEKLPYNPFTEYWQM
jgi:hypothetical protein